MSINNFHSIKNNLNYQPSIRDENSEYIKLDWNECILKLSKKEKKIILNSIKSIDFNLYPPVINNYLLKLISQYTKLKCENISFFNGSDAALKTIIDLFVTNKTKVLLFNPDYHQVQTFIFQKTKNVEIRKIKNIFDNPKYDFSKIELFDIIYISNPNNPTGHLINIKELENNIKNHKNIIFIIDEAYFEYSNQTIAPLVQKNKNLIVTRTFSKAYPLTALRFGYICAHNKTIKKINKIKNCKEINAMAQKIAVCVLENISLFSKRIDKINKNKIYFCKKLKFYNIQHSISHGNFIFIRHKNAKKIIECLKNKYKILVRDRSMFIKNCFRVTIGEKNQIDLIIKVILNES